MDIQIGETLFVDTNVLLTATDASRHNHHLVRRLLSRSRREPCHFGLSAQVLREYLAVATESPNRLGLGLAPRDALANARAFRRRLAFFEEAVAVADRLAELVQIHDLAGVRIHDANIAATMLAHGLTRLMTDNTDDFAAYTDIEAVTPQQVSDWIVEHSEQPH